jgi:hypothetical protein
VSRRSREIDAPTTAPEVWRGECETANQEIGTSDPGLVGHEQADGSNGVLIINPVSDCRVNIDVAMSDAFPPPER